MIIDTTLMSEQANRNMNAVACAHPYGVTMFLPLGVGLKSNELIANSTCVSMRSHYTACVRL